MHGHLRLKKKLKLSIRLLLIIDIESSDCISSAMPNDGALFYLVSISLIQHLKASFHVLFAW